MGFIEARDLRKIYTPKGAEPVHALDGLDLDVPEGTITAILGPNGAGKTTAVKVLTTLITPDSGTATIGGVNVLNRPEAIRPIIGVSGQYAAVDENLTGFENLDMVGRLYHLGARASRARARELIDLFELSEAQNRPVKGFSGGMRRRIDLAGALVTRPRVLFLDEPTTGLDPRSRLGMWDIIRSLVDGGTTVLLTTQYLEEADQLADDISVIDTGKVIAKGTADELKASVGGQRVELNLVTAENAAETVEIMRRLGTAEPAVSNDSRTVTVSVESGPEALRVVLAELSERNIALFDAGMRRPTLDDVFLRLTGHVATDESDDTTETASGRTRARKTT
ncbi:ATP-binding cassette domain-containing protein [Mycetocola zhadangensis]|uniref:ATP-binding cassette domain-containing protein n=1 Tax=Mycetocola zhadangensis TaxID=1164595 RepID=A0A3L7J7J8_9MICO|nr:ATP-binding cassette domain-containing protein [Mycetocola zhadangensis]RLQ84482.1 ATP-binding cassette domain-containing protein [Mycetocola zhadangensis]GGE92627.1 daunorubicin resistance protein DrrA family ABC transporter ATP-binding protein [Mycetocola zhadangensis]